MTIRTTWTQLSRDGLRGDRYGIALLDDQNRFLPFHQIQDSIREFFFEAEERPQMRFEVEEVHGRIAEQLKPLLRGAPKNVILPKEWS